MTKTLPVLLAFLVLSAAGAAASPASEARIDDIKIVSDRARAAPSIQTVKAEVYRLVTQLGDGRSS